MTTYRIRWTAQGKEFDFDLRAANEKDARRAFEAYMLPGVGIVSIKPIEPGAAAPPIPSGPPDSPFSPLQAHRKLDDTDNGR